MEPTLNQRSSAVALAGIAVVGNLVMLVVAFFTGFHIWSSPASLINSAKAQAICWAAVPGLLVGVAALVVSLVRLARSRRNRLGLVLAVLAAALFVTALIISVVLPTATGIGSDPWG